MLKLIDTSDPTAGVAIDEAALKELATFVLEHFYPGCMSEAAHEAHAYHDHHVAGCVDCRIHRAFDGNGWVVAATQIAFACMSEAQAPEGEPKGCTAEHPDITFDGGGAVVCTLAVGHDGEHQDWSRAPFTGELIAWNRREVVA